MGHVLQGGTGQAPGRQAMLKAGVVAALAEARANNFNPTEGHKTLNYWPRLRELQVAAGKRADGMYVPLLNDIEASFARIHGLRSRMRFLIWRQLRVYVEEPGLSRIVLHEVRTGPDGAIVSRKVIKSSGNKAWDDAVLKALDKTESLPRDTDGRTPPHLVIGFRP